jgi:hypothetical protein
MDAKRSLRKILILLAVFVIYSTGLLRNVSESSRRSLQLRDDAATADCVFISATVVSLNPATRELTAQLAFRPFGEIAQDEVTPRTNLKLLVNNVRGQQEFDFPKGQRMSRIEATFPLDGDVNMYPLDQYETTLSFFMTMPGKTKQPPTPPAPLSWTNETPDHSHELAVGQTALLSNVPVPLSVSLSASIPGIKFVGAASRSGDSNFTGIDLKMRRPDNLILVSTFVMLMMTGLAVSVLAMVLKAIGTRTKFDLLPLSLSISLIFGLPALRNIQPGVPPVGVLGDYLSFLWAELIVAASAIVTVWTWLRSESEEESKPPVQ